MKPKHLKKLLLSEIKAVSEKSNEYCVSSGKDFTRKRKSHLKQLLKH